VAVVEKLREIVPDGDDLEFLFLGPGGELEKEAMEKELVPSRRVMSGKLRRYFSFSYIPDVLKIPVGIFQSLWQLLVFMPDVVFSKGGYAGVPVVVAAWAYRIPIIIHESDIAPGLANQFGARLSRTVAVAFPGAANFFNPTKVVITGNPIREDLTRGSKEEAQKIFGLSGNRKIIFVTGGSQGARAINEALVRILPDLLKKYEVIHQTGRGEYENVVQEAGKIGIKAGHEGYHPYPFLSAEIPYAFAVADLVVSRPGANSINEIAANAKPSIIIPPEHSANNHQSLNAYAVQEAGAAVVLDQDNLGENILFGKIEEVLNNSEFQFELKERVKKFHDPDASKKIALEIVKLAQ
jgi:UDP-N-acetylglucosamine--N-acetylmuramyl-(pentapeptide) pyrophosphoryl-undecaprenol N-acetylglucosamine transferase